jgi:predicted phosphodiesterase
VLEEKNLERIFFLSDPHIPYHDKRAFELTLRALKRFKPTILISVGDFVDFYAVSSYSKDPRRAYDLEGELGVANATLDRIDKLTPGARRVYIAGNHEDRLQRFLKDKAPQLLWANDVPKLLRLRERGWEYVAYKNDIRIGKVHITHDVGSAGRYNAFKCLDTYQTNIVTGHTHRLVYVVEGDATGGRKVSAQFGWLGDVEQIDYMHRVKARREWTLGFGYGYLAPRTGYVYLVPVPIVNNSCVVEGRLHT